jgi:hypothetical protein
MAFVEELCDGDGERGMRATQGALEKSAARLVRGIQPEIEQPGAHNHEELIHF